MLKWTPESRALRRLAIFFRANHSHHALREKWTRRTRRLKTSKQYRTANRHCVQRFTAMPPAQHGRGQTRAQRDLLSALGRHLCGIFQPQFKIFTRIFIVLRHFLPPTKFLTSLQIPNSFLISDFVLKLQNRYGFPSAFFALTVVVPFIRRR